MEKEFAKIIEQLSKITSNNYKKDFLLTWEKTEDELKQTFLVAEALRLLRTQNISTRCFDSGLAISNFRDNSTRTRFSFASAANLLGLEVQDLDEKTSQIAHGETVRETANMISFMADFIGIRDDMFLGEGDKYQRQVGQALDEGFSEGVLEQRPGIINLQSDIDHPTQSMSDFLHLINHFGGIENLKGKKVAMTWAYSPSYGKPLSVPQGVIGLFTRFGMEVDLAYPEGYDLISETEELAAKQAKQSGGKFRKISSMEEAFKNADIVYPKSWAPFSVMQERTSLLLKKDVAGLDALEKRCLDNNAKHKDWECTEDKMKLTKNQNALYLHCLPADISGVSCKQGEVQASVFEKYKVPLYKQAGYKPYIIAAMMLNYQFKNPHKVLKNLYKNESERIKF
ncbi:MAG TPA: knotted carbamoyltransferase YgeW [Marinilabiliales bacterium]|nr:MAG: knotted carbamoyltransferase YgeW [Bacteroidetes bacterium GWC2_40_13]OFX75264.1 MAG: knotted carbamoyltransferase YgeW [Bacteroidetes bacterium GWD2_40_43]OFX89861.1 MAG: knotted carbamoyltransferase YgeW [Bacteroidetes bacterium GWE2_40_63]OFY17777.1 MAG: knotted carbamoyltransferase YgeW [Bacteroidetes bacterium GWF2_40_13]OFZ30293.1 MAG: knotted carbamoyltransferase YgeW [Bacteroidetes bacterium RIFOXYC2_FULL_40_12]HAM96994.1 knotted carbamoyltransferase YgeW [Marinilabiliales bact